jgi:hypothetical protein
VNLLGSNPAGSQTVTLQPSVAGQGFSLQSQNPVAITGGATVAISVIFSPTVVGNASATLTLSGGSQNFSFNLSGAGIVPQTPQFTTSYIAGPNGNEVAVGNGGTLNFVAAKVNASSTATFFVRNTGTTASHVNSVRITSGDPIFQISGLQLLPANVPAGGELHFTLTFLPTLPQSYSGTLQLGLDSGTVTINLAGRGSTFTVENISTSPATVIQPNTAISFPGTAVGKSASMTIRVTNTGDVTASINSITVAGTSVVVGLGPNFVLSNLRPFPITLAPGAATTFQIAFSPTSVGDLTDQLLIDSLQFDLKGTGLGSKLDFSFTVGSATGAIANGGTALFPNTAVGNQVAGVFTITNNGNQPGTVTSISISGSPFTAQTNSLSFPAVIPVSSSLNLTVIFTPNGVGTLSGSLAIDSVNITLRGTGGTPAPVPTYSFNGTTSSAGALQQPSIGLQLDSTYPFDITGTLSLTFAPTAGVDDPTIQFAQVGRSVTFTIPANSRDALFGQLKQVQFSTGTVAGTITLTPSFAVNGVNNTPSTPLVNRVIIPAGAPVLRNLQVGTRTPTSFELLITGYSTARDVSGIVLLFSPGGNKALQTTSINVNVSTAFGAWYQTAASSTVGSQFTVSITINVTGDSGAVQAVSVGASNSLGTSNSLGISLQ